MCNYTLLPAPVKVLETFLEATAWKSFQLLRRISTDDSSIRAMSLQCWFQSRDQVTNSWSHARGSTAVVTLFFAKKSLTNTDLCNDLLDQLDATIMIDKPITQHVSGTIVPIFSSTMLYTTAYGFQHLKCWLESWDSGRQVVCAV